MDVVKFKLWGYDVILPRWKYDLFIKALKEENK